MTERRTIGQILVSIGRIGEDDVARALEYQRDNGGYFGEALIACGFVTPEELEWGLASQFDLPYVFPDPDAVDPDAAALVAPEWALSNLTMPILRTDTSLKVVVESPLKDGPIEELSMRTGLDIELALASPGSIRELIRQVYARASAADEAPRTPMELSDALDAVIAVSAPRFGVSVRGVRAHVWWDDRGTVRRRPLAGEWRSALDRVLIPGPADVARGVDRADWEAEIGRAGVILPVSVRYMADDAGREYLFRPREMSSSLETRFTPPAAGVLSEVRVLARSGAARFVVVTDPPELGHEILPHLPTILFDPTWRSIYVHGVGRDSGKDVFSASLPDDPATWQEELETLRAFHFDVVTVDLDGSDGSWAGSAIDVASVAFLLWNRAEGVQPAYEAGIRWTLGIRREAGDHLAWSLEALRP